MERAYRIVRVLDDQAITPVQARKELQQRKRLRLRGFRDSRGNEKREELKLRMKVEQDNKLPEA
jgi:hypothetical protein